jgi:AcrR family transcriptional regulator
MRQDRTDRRSQRTRQLLSHGLIELLEIKRYNSITVQEIADRANVGRSTFYAHFTDKDDLFVAGVRRMVHGLDKTGPAQPLFPSLALLHHVGANYDLHSMLVKGGGLALFLNTLQEELTVIFTERLTTRVPPSATPSVPLPLLAAMITSMLITAVRSWLDSKLSEPAEAIDRAFNIAADGAIRAGLRPLG